MKTLRVLAVLWVGWTLAFAPTRVAARSGFQGVLASKHVPVARVRWHFKHPATWTLDLHYSTARAWKLHRELAVEYPQLALDSLPRVVTSLSDCDVGARCADFHEVVTAAEHVVQQVGTLRWTKRYGGIELLAGVILPSDTPEPPDFDARDAHRLLLELGKPIDSGPDMLNVRLTVF